MPDTAPQSADIPSKKAIAKATAAALAVAAIILFAAILPAEYGIDLLGIGGVLGLSALSQTESESAAINTPHPAPYQEHQAEIVLAPREGQEYKFKMEAGSGMLYSWKSSAPLSYDFHGEPENAAPGEFQSYEKNDSGQAHGSFNAPFTGTHGWYWENPTNAPVAITLATAGFYTPIGNPRKPLQRSASVTAP